MGYNAIKVTQTAVVNLWFGGLVGMKSMNLVATSSAAMKGASNTPYNLAVIMDTTGSMADTVKGDKDCTTSQISCAVQGLESMLNAMDPCQLNTACTSGTSYVDDVALFVFPAISTNYSANSYSSDYCGSGKKRAVQLYQCDAGLRRPEYGCTRRSGHGNADIPQIQMRACTRSYPSTILIKRTTQRVSLSSALAQAVAFKGTGCSGLSAPGGQGTYYAQVIYAAQAALVTQQANESNLKERDDYPERW